MKKTIILLCIILGLGYGIYLIVEGYKYKDFTSADPCIPPLPSMDFLIENTCYLTCKIPTDVETILRITEKCLEPDLDSILGNPTIAHLIRKFTIPNLRKYKKQIKIIPNEDHDGVYLKCWCDNDSIHTPLFGFSPCDSKKMIGEFPGEYNVIISRFINGCYFDNNNLPVGDNNTRQKIVEEFRIKIEKLEEEYMAKHPSNYYMYDDIKVKLYQFYEYRKEGGLYLLCDKRPLQSSLIFYEKLEKELRSICEKHELSRIIFCTLDYLQKIKYGISQHFTSLFIRELFITT